MTGLYAGIDEAPFKRTAGGWVFQTHNKWLLGSRDRYFVTDAQKTFERELTRQQAAAAH